MPVLRWETALRVAQGIQAHLSLETGVTRTGGTPNGASPKNQKLIDAGQLEKAREQIEEQRRMLESKNLEITRLKMQLAATKGSKENDGVSASAPGRGALPDFLIIGAQKAGTTYLYHLLCQHPDVEPATEKEIQYFSVRCGKGLDWYRSHFWASEGNKQRVLTGEASPYYIYHPHAARRAAETIPQAKIIALLRNPVDRAYSDYHHKFREGREPLKSFEEAIEAEPKRLEGERERMLSDEGYSSMPYRRFSYLSRGIYVDQLMEWSKHFDRDQLLVLKSEELFERPTETLRRVFEVLELPYHQPAPSDLRNEGEYASMNPATRRQLEEFFEPHNRRLYEYLGEDFSW